MTTPFKSEVKASPHASHTLAHPNHATGKKQEYKNRKALHPYEQEEVRAHREPAVGRSMPNASAENVLICPSNSSGHTILRVHKREPNRKRE